MTMKKYSLLPRGSEQEPHSQMQCHTQDILFFCGGGVLPTLQEIRLVYFKQGEIKN